MKKTSIAPALAATVLAAAAGAGHAQEASASHAPPTNWNDTSIGARYSNDLHFPGSASKVAQKIVTVNSTGGFKYGSYMFNVDFLKSDMNNPEANGSSGAQEVYSVGHVTWSFGKMLGRRVAFGPVRDVGFTTGYELSSKNDAFGSRARMVTLGPTLEFAVPRGFWNLTLGVRTEDNHNGISHADVHYDPAWHLESAWAAPLNLGPASAVFKGFAAVTGPKGKDGFHTSTTTETLVRASLLFDVGALVGGSPRTFYFGPGYEYWKNMFGTPASESPGTKRSAFMLVGEIHF
jgi:nucleoside-specific outer membrane channel protein Tsx